MIRIELNLLMISPIINFLLDSPCHLDHLCNQELRFVPFYPEDLTETVISYHSAEHVRVMTFCSVL